MTLDELYDNIEIGKKELSKRRPLTEAEVERLNEDFMIEYTYNSNAIEGNTLTLRETAMVLRGLTIDKKPLKEHLEAVQHRKVRAYARNIRIGKNRRVFENIQRINARRTLLRFPFALNFIFHIARLPFAEQQTYRHFRKGQAVPKVIDQITLIRCRKRIRHVAKQRNRRR